MADTPKDINREEFTKVANERFKLARDFWREWRVEAIDNYAFVSGKQWSEEDEAKLRMEKRPPITFNYSEKMIDAVVGAEVSNRQEVTFLPRNPENSGATDLWNAAAKWCRNGCNAEDEESDAFRDALITGMGWTWTRMDYSEDRDGMVVIDRIDPLEMYPDPSASKPGVIDRKYQFREYWVANKEIRATWPDALPTTLDDGDDANTAVIVTGQTYRDDNKQQDRERHRNQSKLRLYECVELEPYYLVAGDSDTIELNEQQFGDAKNEIKASDTPYVRMMKRIYYRAFFADDTLLEVANSPSQAGFTFQCITGKRDRNKNTWYGLTRVMKDPQRWANKWLSQILHIINSNAKGGIMAEIGAFVDATKAQEEWAQPDSVTLFNEGALSGGKVKEKQVTQYPAGLDKLMSFALESLPMVTGINLEALGLANRDQAGVVEAQRKQAAYGLLAPLFDALRRYRKEQGHILLHYINEYISDGRMIRIGGPENAQYLPLIKQPGSIQYDLIVDQAPNSPDSKDKTWSTLVEIIPAMLKAGIAIPPDVLDYTPLPTSLSSKWKQFFVGQQQQNEEQQQQMDQLQQENQQLKAGAQQKQAELQFEVQKAQAEMQMAREKQQSDLELAKQKAQADYELKAWQAQQDFKLESMRAQHEAGMQQQQQDHQASLDEKRAQNDFKVKAFAAGINQEDGADKGAERKVSIGIDTSALSQMLEQVAQQQAKTNDMTMQVISQLTKVMSAPRKLLTDASGNPVGSQPVLQ